MLQSHWLLGLIVVLYQCRKTSTLKTEASRARQKGQTMDIWDKVDSLTFYLGESDMLDELIRYLTISQLEDAVEFIARNNDYDFDSDEMEE